MRRYLDNLQAQHRRQPIVFGEHVFVFDGETLVTVLQLPNNLKGRVGSRAQRKPGAPVAKVQPLPDVVTDEDLDYRW